MQAAGPKQPEAYSLQYVEDCFELRTTQTIAELSPQPNGGSPTDSARAS